MGWEIAVALVALVVLVLAVGGSVYWLMDEIADLRVEKLQLLLEHTKTALERELAQAKLVAVSRRRNKEGADALAEALATDDAVERLDRLFKLFPAPRGPAGTPPTDPPSGDAGPDI